MKLRAIIISISILLGSSVVHAGGSINLSNANPVYDWTAKIGEGEYGIQIRVDFWAWLRNPGSVLGNQRRYVAVFGSHEWSVSEKNFWIFTGVFLALIVGTVFLRDARKSNRQGQAMDQTLLDRKSGE